MQYNGGLERLSLAQWQSGDAADCKSVYVGSIPACASSVSYLQFPWAPNLPAQAPSYSQWSAQALPQATALQQAWLNRPGALTAGLRNIGHVDLRVIRECPSLLTADEAWMLAHPVNTPIWLREIVMAINGEDVVFARSFTPLAASTGLWHSMRSLQTRPLADMLYHNREISRSGFFHSRLSPQQPMYHSARHALGAQCPPAGALLARCSVFRREQVPLLVAESFLPAFWDMAGDLS